MAAPARTAARLRLLRLASPPSSRGFTTTTTAAQKETWSQNTPLGAYYESLLDYPLPVPAEKPEEPPEGKPQAPPPAKEKPGRKPGAEPSRSSPTPSESPATSPPVPSPPPQTAQEKARLIFGSRVLGLAEQNNRQAAKKAQSTYLAGVLIPPKPEEPDNCCMSGCVNCVWDLFRDDMEEWSAKKNEAQRRINDGSGTMDDDGGGSAAMASGLGSSKIVKDMWDEDVLQNVPVGIREFMKQEKRLKEKHRRDGSLAG